MSLALRSARVRREKGTRERFLKLAQNRNEKKQMPSSIDVGVDVELFCFRVLSFFSVSLFFFFFLLVVDRQEAEAAEGNKHSREGALSLSLSLSQHPLFLQHLRRRSSLRCFF